MPYQSPWSLPEYNADSIGSALGGILMQRKMLQLQALELARQRELEQQRLGLQKEDLNMRRPLIEAQTKKFTADTSTTEEAGKRVKEVADALASKEG